MEAEAKNLKESKRGICANLNKDRESKEVIIMLEYQNRK